MTFASPPGDSHMAKLETTRSEDWFSYFNRDQNNNGFKKKLNFSCGKDKLVSGSRNQGGGSLELVQGGVISCPSLP